MSAAPTLAPILQFVLSEHDQLVLSGHTFPRSPRLDSMAAFLPAVPSAGIEFPLLGQATAIDLQQRVRTTREVHRLKRLVESSASYSHGQSASHWANVIRFCESGRLGAEVEELWLELDDAESSPDPPPLSVFIRLSAAARLPGFRQTAGNILCDGFGIQAPEAQWNTLVQCLEACLPPAHISHLGLMLGRPGAPWRLIVDGIPFDDFGPFLQRAGWSGDIADAQQRIDALFSHVDRVRVALTLGDALHQTLGLECFVGCQGEMDPRWRCVFDDLVRQRLCGVEERNRFFSWPAILTPFSARGAWPDSLLAEAVARSPEEIGWLECQLSHIKITYHPDLPPSAKAYVGFLEVWEQALPAASEPSKAIMPGNTGPCIRSAPCLAGAVKAALEFLLTARTQAGWWLDYDGFEEGVSDEWVTAYVAHAIDESGDPRGSHAAQRAWTLLEGRPRAGWGWNYLQPADADSTLWALRLVSRLGKLGCARAQAAIGFLREHMQPEGGLATYLQSHRNSWSTGQRVNPAWCEPHVCVTAAAAGFPPLGDAPLDYLRQNQRSDGRWQSYWWRSSFYATAHAAEALGWRGEPGDCERVERSVAWAASLVETGIESASGLEDEPFQLALALRILLLSRVPSLLLIAAATRRLLRAQQSDGSWASSATLYIPNALGKQVEANDCRRTLTTATVLRTLNRLRELECAE